MEKTHRLRVLLVALASILVYGAIEARLYHVQIQRHNYYRKLADGQHGVTVTFPPRRGEIVDRNRQVLAASTFYHAIYFNPQMIDEGELPADAAARIARLLGKPEARIERLLRRKGVTLLERKAPPEIREAMQVLVADLELPSGAIFYEKQSQRLYPAGDLAGPVIGFTKLVASGDDVGQAGLELEYDEALQGKQRRTRVPANLGRRGMKPVDEGLLRGTFGDTVVLTLDSQIQHYAQQALRRQVGHFQAKSGVAVVMDVKTGAILAMANCPDFDPNDYGSTVADQRRNRALTDPIEIGSVMKILTTTILMDRQLLSPDEMVDGQGGRAYVNGRLLRDAHRMGVVPFREAFAESSNIVMATVGLRIDPRAYYAALKKFGLGDKLGVDLPGESGGLLRPVSEWTRDSLTSLPIGYETSLTALQTVTAVAAVGNGGRRMRPYIVDRIESVDGRTIKKTLPTEIARVASPETCRTVIELMEEVVEHGTGTGVQIPGYRIAAKTGTTRKHTEERAYIASMAALAPAEEPRLAIYVFVNEPNVKMGFYGGTVAGPVVKEIAENALRILNIEPSRPEQLLAQGEDGSEERGDRGTAPAIPPGEDAATAFDPFVMADAPVLPDEAAAIRPSAETNLEGAFADEPGAMPYCLGMTMAEVVELFARRDVDPRFMGSGLAVRQSPAPGTKLAEGQQVSVIFASPSQRQESLEAAAASRIADHEKN